jgi:aminoglycoside phosphotransferase
MLGPYRARVLDSGRVEDHLATAAGPGAHALLRAAVGDAEVLSCRLRQVHHRPHSSTTATWELRVRDRGGEHAEVLGVRLLAGDPEAQVWRFPHDPALPGLAAATDETRVRALLDRCDVEPGPVELRVRGYRPGRRAVVEVRTPAVRLFLKVVRPSAGALLAERHRLLRAAGLPVPPVLAAGEDGRLLLEALPGTSLRARLRDGADPAPGGPELLELLDLLPAALCALPRRTSWTDEVRSYAFVTAGALPGEAERCRQLAEAVRAAVDDEVADEPVHGDLHEAQLLLSGGRVTGLLDVDTAGPGRRADDLACLLAHAHVLAQLEPAHAATTLALARRWLAAFDRRVDPADLRARTAGVVVSLATGPHRVQAPGWQDLTRARLDLAEQWLGAAGGGPAPVRSSR